MKVCVLKYCFNSFHLAKKEKKKHHSSSESDDDSSSDSSTDSEESEKEKKKRKKHKKEHKKKKEQKHKKKEKKGYFANTVYFCTFTNISPFNNSSCLKVWRICFPHSLRMSVLKSWHSTKIIPEK